MSAKKSSQSKGFKSLADQLADFEDPTPKGLRPPKNTTVPAILAELTVFSV
jgi:hypothetical protein